MNKDEIRAWVQAMTDMAEDRAQQMREDRVLARYGDRRLGIVESIQVWRSVFGGKP
jgi:hypothetical protein